MSARSKRRRACHSTAHKRRGGLLTALWLLAVVVGLSIKPENNDSVLAVVPLNAGTGGFPARRRRNRRQPNKAGATYSRFSCELQDDTSIQTQQERCHEAANADGNQIAAQFECFDRAVSGTKLHRDGLDALLAAAKAGLFNVLYLFSLSRLARESIIGMPILKRLVYKYKVRVISVTEGVDSARPGWENQAQILLMQHERYIKELSENSFRGQKGNIGNKFANGDHCFGYASEPVPGTENTRRGRRHKPRMKYVIDPVAAEWVRRIFFWFVTERRSLRWITRRLNHLHVPKDHRSSTPKWHHQALARLLANIKLIGLWPWGRLQNVRDPETGIVSQEERPKEESEKWLRQLPDLRLIDDETFFKAQELLAENAKHYAHRHDEGGRFTEDQADASLTNPVHLLSGLIVCALCGRKFYVGGSHGRYLFCPGYVDGSCSCRTTLRRDLAAQLILGQIAERIMQNAEWLTQILVATIAAWQRLQTTLPNELRDTEAALTEVNRKIQRLLDMIEGHDSVDPEIQDRLAERRVERDQLEGKLARLRQQAECLPAEPTAAWVAERIGNLEDVLASSTPAAAFALRELVSGVIVVEEVQAEGRKRRHLRGTFHMEVRSIMSAAHLGVQAQEQEAGSPGERFSIDFVAPNPLDAAAERVKALYDQGQLSKAIATELGCSPSQICKLLRHWEILHGVKLPNGHVRRTQITLQANPPFYQQIAARAYELLEKGLLIAEIADELNCDINTARKAARTWCEAHSLPWVDGRTRRKGLDHKSRPDKEADGQNHDQDDDGDAAPVAV